MRVFYEHWQMECCGSPFGVGEEVAWKLVAYDREDRRRNAGHGAEAWVENHGGPDRETVGRVRAIDLVHQEFLAHHDPRATEAAELADLAPGTVVFRSTGRKLEPVPGPPTLEPVDSCPRWFDAFEQEEQPPRRVPFRVRRAVGVLVALEVPDATPSEPGDRP
ncbi:DUF6578 domain-containing protein [Streptomyces sp. NPDC007905]|uniref:DUF6578 domain-containing protein n=1 Tax=Streptomyces sp. NPDC007905 TaxID=3364788 RepID=UPI0036E36D57